VRHGDEIDVRVRHGDGGENRDHPGAWVEHRIEFARDLAIKVRPRRVSDEPLDPGS